MKQDRITFFVFTLFVLGLMACSSGEAVNDGGATAVAPANDEANARPAGWMEETHSNEVDPNYDVVFPQDRVNQITITIAPDDWEAMQANMTELLGAPGQRGGAPPGNFGPPQGAQRPEMPEGERPQMPDGERPAMPGEGGQPPVDGFNGRLGGPGAGGPGNFMPENPMWVSATIEFEGSVWTNVGVRYKGNSSLQSGWSSGSHKLPLKLDFDEFEDEYLKIGNQRFYGFKQLSLANGFSDNAFMRETIAYDLLADAGLVAAETTYYEVILDYGQGPESLGLYIMVEVVDDTVIDRYFDDDDGNIYEGEGAGASLAAGSYELIADAFQKENNEDEADWSDIEALYDVLHSETRTTDPETWRTELESIFDVDAFLEWLALSAVLQHWDSYGRMSHNFYLYNDPDSGQLTWISWDHNMVLGGSPDGGGNRDGRRGGIGAISLDQAEVGEGWPLIRYLLDDAIYHERYMTYLAEAATLFDPDALTVKYQELAELIRPYAVADVGEDEFATAVQQLTDRTYEQAAAVAEFLDSQE